ncbi:hypothetical protein ACLKA6_004412 [Drosophila palustris]
MRGHAFVPASVPPRPQTPNMAHASLPPAAAVGAAATAVGYIIFRALCADDLLSLSWRCHRCPCWCYAQPSKYTRVL